MPLSLGASHSSRKYRYTLSQTYSGVTASTDYTIPAGITEVAIFCYGKGGDGGVYTTAVSYGIPGAGGGGGGGLGAIWNESVSGGTINVAISATETFASVGSKTITAKAGTSVGNSQSGGAGSVGAILTGSPTYSLNVTGTAGANGGSGAPYNGGTGGNGGVGGTSQSAILNQPEGFDKLSLPVSVYSGRGGGGGGGGAYTAMYNVYYYYTGGDGGVGGANGGVGGSVNSYSTQYYNGYTWVVQWFAYSGKGGNGVSGVVDGAGGGGAGGPGKAPNSSGTGAPGTAGTGAPGKIYIYTRKAKS